MLLAAVEERLEVVNVAVLRGLRRGRDAVGEAGLREPRLHGRDGVVQPLGWALHSGLRHPERLAGSMARSTALPFPEVVEAERHELAIYADPGNRYAATSSQRQDPFFLFNWIAEQLLQLVEVVARSAAAS